MDALITAGEPLIVLVLGFVFTACINAAALSVRRFFGAKAEEIMRSALHSAIETGLKQPLPQRVFSSEAVIEAAVEYAKRSVPDAIKALGATETVLRALALSKASQLTKTTVLPVK